MGIQFSPSPTLAETKALASIPSTRPLKYESVHEALGEMLAFCRRPDVNGFLFTPEPIQASHFLKPNVLGGMFTGTMFATRVEPEKELDNAHITDHTTASYLLSPAFVSQNLSFGFAVNSIVYSPWNAWEAETGFSYNSETRYVRDNEKRILLSLMDAEEVDLVQLQYTHQLSTTCQYRAIACFARKRFKAMITRNRYCVADVLGAMYHIQTGLEYRACPLCRAHQGECLCELPRYQPKHPFDREIVRQNIQMHLGSFQGSVNVAVLDEGRFSKSIPVGSRMTILGRFDGEVADRLRRWVLRKHCGSHSPLESYIFSNNYENEKGKSSFSVDNSKMEADAEDFLKALGTSPQTAGGSLDPQDSYGHISELLTGMGTEGQGASDSTSALTNFGVLASRVKEASVQSSAEAVQSSSATRHENNTFNLPRHTKAPRKGESARDEVQRRKEERRKEQNRKSARKSNQKKKAFNDELKRSLKEAHEKTMLLRAQELRLRKENLELRRRLGQE